MNPGFGEGLWPSRQDCAVVGTLLGAGAALMLLGRALWPREALGNE